MDSTCIEELNDQFSFLFEEGLIKEICQIGRRKQFQADDVIMDIGDQIEYIPIVLNGSIKVMKEDENGEDLLLYYLEFGDTCAVTLNCCTKKTQSTIKAIAETDSSVIFVPSKKLEEWMIHYKSWRDYILESYQVRLNEMLSAIDTLVFSSLEERLVKYLRDKAWVQKSSTLLISHQEIANDLHSSRVVISRLMKKLDQNGLIKQNRNRVEYLEFSK